MRRDRPLGAFFTADDDDRYTAEVDGLTGNVFQAVVVEAAFNLDGVDEGRAEWQSAGSTVIAVGLVHSGKLALVAGKEDRRIGGFAGDVQQGVPKLG